MLIFRNLLMTLILSLCVSAAAEDSDVYRWVDADGEVHFSDRPLSKSAKRLEITSRPTDNARINQERQARMEREQAQKAVAIESSSTEESAGEEAERMAENCRRARAALASIVNARRLYEPAQDGSRRYLDADQIAQRRAKAESDVAQWCN